MMQVDLDVRAKPGLRPPIMSVHVETRFQPPQEEGIPAIALQITCLVNSYMLWAGATGEEDAESAVTAGRLVADWACAMPPISVWQLFFSWDHAIIELT